MLRLVWIIALSLLTGVSLAAAQGAPAKLAGSPAKISQPLPFSIGETLTYEVTFSRLIFSGVIGELKLSVSPPSDSSKTELIELKAEAVSKGFFPALFGLKVRDQYVSLVSQTDFGLLTSTKLVEEGRVRREQKSVVDRQSGRVTYTDRDLANTRNEPKIKQKTSPSWLQDLLSAIYFVRTQPLNEGDVVSLPLSEAGEIYNIDVIAEKREEVKSAAGRLKAIRLNARVFGGRYVKRSGEMLVWLTDDSRRIPLRARIKTSGTTITVELKRAP